MTVKRIKPAPKVDMDPQSVDNFFREIVEQVHTGIASHKADGTIIYINQYLADLMGYSRDYIIGKSSFDFLDKQEKQAVIKIQKDLKKQRQITRERCIIRKDGSVLWTRVNLIAKVDERGELSGYNAIHTDITEQKMAEEAMVNSERTFRDLVEGSGSIIMKADKDLNITYMNDYGLKFFGYTSGELLGKNVLGTTIPKHDDSGRNLESMTLDIKNDPESFRTNVHQNMRKSGELVWISWTNVPKYDDDGKLIEILAIGNDISRLIKAEEAQRESQMKSEMMIKYAPVGIYEIDYAGPKFISVNDAMCRISGYSREELLSMSPQQLFDEQNSLVFTNRIRKVLAGETPKENVEYKIRTKNGKEIWATLNTKILVDQNKSTRAFVIAHDITELKLTEEALRTSEDKFSKSFHFSPIAITITRLSDGKIIEGNESVYELLGFNHEEVIGKTTMEIGIWSNPEDRKRLIKILLVNGFVKNEEFTLLKKDRTPVIVNLSAALIKIEGQDCFLSSFIDITERKKAEEALRKSEEKNIIINDLAPFAIGLMKFPENTIIQVNVAYERMFGLSPGEAIGKTPNQLGISLDPEGRQRMFSEVLKLGSVHGLELEYATKSGEKHTGNFAFNLIEIDGKKYMLGTGFDITEQKKMEYALKESQEMFFKSFHTSPIAQTISVLPEDRWTEVNEAFLKLFEYSRDEVIGHTTAELGIINGAERTRVMKLVNTKGSVRSIEMNARTKTGRKVVVLSSNEPILINGKQHAISTLIDITDRKRIENELEKYNKTLEERVHKRTEEVAAERKRLYNVLETLPVYVILLDKDYRVPFANKFFRERFGESKGKRCYEYLFDKTAECDGCETYKVMRTKAPHHWEWTGRDNRNYDVYDYPFFEADGSMLILEMGIDVTEKRLAEEKLMKQQEYLLKLNEDLLKSNKELESFAYITSHDLQEPLRMVTSYTQLLAMKYKDQLDENANDYINFAVDGAKRMFDLINGLLQYSRISRKDASFSDVDTNKIIEAVNANLAHVIKERDVKIITINLPVISADYNQMIQLFQNLIANGIKFSTNVPKITVTSKKEEEHYLFSIKDNGIGIESLYFDKIFEIFKRLKPREEYEGTGIGLAICKRIVENHNGRIWVESQPGKGSVFYFTIPIKKIGDIK